MEKKGDIWRSRKKKGGPVERKGEQRKHMDMYGEKRRHMEEKGEEMKHMDMYGEERRHMEE
ncbi:hypothetical protein KP79_PYT00681 [Mizuhopecten yessoensis]|uniref:Uncharacterized protein n=1 Tax=Mizuhopecten yessoensis TaxID=6573 RepID=A0A210QSJ8_MIZYE|nr:hypothetical protein KP79_PYT00681 [Mizuhopecten yessoensis]